MLDNDKNRMSYADGKLVNPEKADLDKDGEISSYEEARGKAIEKSMREQKQEGGPMSMDDQMVMVMGIKEKPEMKSDTKMEDNYTNFIMEEALTEEEEDMLTSKLEQDEELQMLFDKVPTLIG